MAVVGTATLNITPKFPGLTQAIQGELNKASGQTTKAGEKVGQSLGQGASGGLAKSGAIIGAFSAITTSAISSISSHVGDAVSRFDTLNNYPTVMENLGYSSELADASISKMTDHLQGLPTALDSIVSTVQGIVAVTGDLDQATDVGLALNDMLLASGSNTQLVNAAMEQFRQMLSKGKPELEDWKSLTAAMPGQMNQLAQALLGPTANANDLYTALGGGGAEATISMDQLLNKMVELDQTGGGSFASFEEQARTATGGVATSVANMGTAVTRGLSGVLDSIGKDNISTVFTDLTNGIDDVFEAAQGITGTVAPVLRDIYDTAKPLAPQILAVATAFVGLKKAQPILSGLAGTAKSCFEAFRLVRGGAGTFSEAIGTIGIKANPTMIALAGVATIVGVVGTALMDAKARSDNFEMATEGLSKAVSDTTNLDSYNQVISDIGNSSDSSSQSIDDLYASMAEHAQKMQETAQEAQEQISVLNTAQQIISNYAGQSDLSAQALGELQWAIQQVNDQFGTSITLADAIAGKYTNQAGELVILKDSVNQLIEAKKQEIKIDAMSDQLTEAYKAQTDAADAYLQKRNEANQKAEEYISILQRTEGMTYDEAKATIEASTSMMSWNQELDEAKSAMDNADQSVDSLERQLGDAARSASDAANEFDKWGNTVSTVFTQALKDKGGIAAFKDDLRELGVNVSDLNSLSQEQLLQLADAYDGTALSIVDDLSSMGVGMEENAQKTAEGAQQIKDSLNGMGDEVTNAFSNTGMDIEAFSQKLYDAGVSTETLNSIGSANLSALASACQGDMNLMVWAIQNWNNIPMDNKDGTATVDDESLIDAQGNMYTWNGSTLVDQNGNAVIDDSVLIDAQGNLYIWNGSQLKYKSNSANINGNLDSSIRSAHNWNNVTLASKSATVTITQVLKQISNAAGGVVDPASNNVFNAAGGIRPRFHADGAIATKAVPLDIVGEDGAEAIVPLTNRRYSQPFIDLLADGIRDKGGAGNYYYFGDINVDVSQLKDLTTVEDFVNMIIRAKGAM